MHKLGKQIIQKAKSIQLLKLNLYRNDFSCDGTVQMGTGRLLCLWSGKMGMLIAAWVRQWVMTRIKCI